ncbi:hypothetical protein BTM25_53770 [Actinomadura rubteroloni]|uniref:Phage holin family protein n=2 Tax=Actinomadura rubteroloni TaxID=1926885 RepID=A0A2P4UBK3_9ACTN|nr:hypothetical protein BTM25_53770 [Actinomadura rubteroloni]
MRWEVDEMTSIRPDLDGQARTTQRRTSEENTGELVRQAAQQTSELLRAELRLAVAEVKEKGRSAGKGAGMFGGAGLVALYGLGALAAAAIAALALVLPVWLGALIVAVVLFAVAGVLALAGRRETARAVPPVPQEAMASARRDVAEIRERSHR